MTLSLLRFAVTTAALTTSLVAAFDPLSKDNVITYWGQGAYQERLIETCKNPNIDIINVGFVNVFPDQGPGGWPGTNFGNACWGDVYNNSGVETKLLKTCPYIGPDVIECQQTYGKKIFLSIGGGNPSNYYIKNDASGKKFANFLWQAFGPVSAAKAGVPRPWGDAAVDGFDFDIESFIDPAPQKNYLVSGYVAMINQLKNTLFKTDTSKSYYISGAPQCVIPDSHLTSVLQNAWFDLLNIQFYNTDGCSARDAVTKAAGQGTADISYANWILAKSKNPKVRMSLGLPASDTAARDGKYYLQPAEAMALVKRFYKNSLWGGVMLWEATHSKNNTICGTDYAGWMKKILVARGKGKNVATTCTTAKREFEPVLELKRGLQEATCEAGRTATVTQTERRTVTVQPSGSSVAAVASSCGPLEDVTVTETVRSTVYVHASSSVPAASSGSSRPKSSDVSAVPASSEYSPAASQPASSTPATYTSVNVITVSPVPISSQVYGATGSATGPSASAGYGGGHGWGPVPATGGAAAQRSGVIGSVLVAVIGFFVL